MIPWLLGACTRGATPLLADPAIVVSDLGMDAHHATIAWASAAMAVTWTRGPLLAESTVHAALLDPDAAAVRGRWPLGSGLNAAKGDIAVDALGRLVVVFQTEGEGLWLSRWWPEDVDAGSVRLVPPEQARDNNSPDLALVSDLRPRLVWYDGDADVGHIRGLSLAEDLTPEPGLPAVLASFDGAHNDAPDIAAAPDGGTAVAFSDQAGPAPRRLRLTRYDAAAAELHRWVYEAEQSLQPNRATVAIDGMGRQVATFRNDDPATTGSEGALLAMQDLDGAELGGPFVRRAVAPSAL